MERGPGAEPRRLVARHRPDVEGRQNRPDEEQNQDARQNQDEHQVRREHLFRRSRRGWCA
jgi:hypothetical protein